MNEEFKISMLLIDDIELQRIDNFYNDIVDEYVKGSLKEKEQIISQRIMKNLREENKQLKKQNEFLMKCDNRCQVLEQVIERIKDYLEYYLIDNLKYEESQEEFKRLLDILKEVE